MLEFLAWVFMGVLLTTLQILGHSHPVLWFVFGLWAVGTTFKHETKPKPSSD